MENSKKNSKNSTFITTNNNNIQHMKNIKLKKFKIIKETPGQRINWIKNNFINLIQEMMH